MPTLDIPATLTALAANTYGTIVGGSSALLTNDGDTSYVDIDKPSTFPSFSGYQMNIDFPATSIPGVMDYVNLVTVAKGDASPNAAFNLIIDGDHQFWLNIFGALPSVDYAETELSLNVLEEFVTQEMIEAGEVTYLGSTALINDTHTAAFHTRITYVALRVGYTAPGLPPQRVFPREDGLLGPGATRNYPPPRSRQRSPRIHGGYI